MKQTPLRDQRGVAMLLELVLVAAVLGLISLAVYQANNAPSKAKTATPQSTPAAAAADTLAASAAAAVVEDSTADSLLSAEAEAAASDLADTDTDITTLGGAADASF